MAVGQHPSGPLLRHMKLSNNTEVQAHALGNPSLITGSTDRPVKMEGLFVVLESGAF